MRLEGFELRNGYLLAVGEWELDLHNDYDVVRVKNWPESSSAQVALRRAIGDWVNVSQPKSLVLQFGGVTRFHVEEGNPELAADRATISFVGFQSPEEEAVHAYVEDLSAPHQHLIIGMEDESAIRIQSELVTLSVDA